MRKLASRAATAGIACVFMASQLSAEPVNRWWSGWGMGVHEYGWSGTDGTKIYITCDAKRDVGLRVAIRSIDPKPRTQVTFQLNGQTVQFWTNSDGDVDMVSRASINNLYFLFDELRSGSSVTFRFDGLSKTLPLKGSAKGLGGKLCP